VPYLLRRSGEARQVAADLGHLPELLQLRERISQRYCLGIRLSQIVFVAVK
jgi:hypothetical protein